MNAGFNKFREKATATDSVYLKPSEIEGSIKIRVIPWILGKTLVPIQFYYEGWHDVKNAKTKKNDSKPIRFGINGEGEPDGDLDEYQWSEGKFGIQRPKAAFVCVVANMKLQKIQVFSGTQKTLVGPLSALLDSSDDLYIKDWSAYELIIVKDEKTDKFTINREKLDKEDRAYPKWFEAAMSEFHFKMEDYLNCEKTPEGEGHTYRDVMDMVGDKPEEVNESEFTTQEMATWGDFTTPKGSRLSMFPYEKLVDMKKKLEEMKNFDNNSKLYRAILCGIKANEPPKFEREETNEDIGF